MRHSAPPVAATLALFAVGALAALAPRTARAADPHEQQLAQALFDEARQLMEQNRYAEACPKLAESQRLDPGGGTLLNLAVCHEKEHKIATAQVEYGEALGVALRDGRRDREDLARERLRAIDAFVPRLAVKVASAADVEGLDVKVDGYPLRRAAWGVAAPVDPGSHRVEASAPGRTTWSAAVTVAEKERRDVVVPELAPLAPLPDALGSSGPASPASSASPAPPPGAADIPVTPPLLTWEPTRANPAFYATLAVGGAALGTSAVTGLLAFMSSSSAKSGCVADRSFCKDAASLDAAQSARTFAWISTGALAVSGVAAIVLLIVPSRVRAAPAPRVGVEAARGGALLRVSGAF